MSRESIYGTPPRHNDISYFEDLEKNTFCLVENRVLKTDEEKILLGAVFKLYIKYLARDINKLPDIEDIAKLYEVSLDRYYNRTKVETIKDILNGNNYNRQRSIDSVKPLLKNLQTLGFISSLEDKQTVSRSNDGPTSSRKLYSPTKLFLSIISKDDIVEI